MAGCINRNTLEYRTLQLMSGIPTIMLDAYVGRYLDEFGRYPELDELPGVNSEPYLNLQLDLKEHSDFKYTANDKILDYTGKGSIEEANVALNQQYRDLEVTLSPLVDNTIVTVKKRPTHFGNPSEESIQIDSTMNPRKSAAILTESIQKLNRLYGIKINTITSNEVSLFSDIAPGMVSAFIYNGEIYINTDVASMDAPLHEMTHLLMGSIRYSDSFLYLQLVSLVESLDAYDVYAKSYPNRTRGDVDEEIFVSEFAKFLSGLTSLFDNFSPQQINKVIYDVLRVVDSMLMGKYSAKSMTPGRMFNSSLTSIATELQSDILNNKRQSTFSEAEIHRVLSNEKSELMKKGELIEQC